MQIKIKELRQKPASELQIIVKQNREKLRQLKFDAASKKLKNVNEIKFIKRQIAQILTILKGLAQKSKQ
jgi:large subunit ribosomal protein L29